MGLPMWTRCGSSEIACALSEVDSSLASSLYTINAGTELYLCSGLDQLLKSPLCAGCILLSGLSPVRML